MKVNPAIITFYSYNVALGSLGPLTLMRPGIGLNLVNAIVLALIMLWWMQRDAMKRGRSISNWLRWLVACTGPVGLIVHFFQTRSVFGAFLAIVATVLLALLSVVFVAIGAAFTLFACKFDFMRDYCAPEFLGG